MLPVAEVTVAGVDVEPLVLEDESGTLLVSLLGVT
jgi:hypothetical protein